MQPSSWCLVGLALFLPGCAGPAPPTEPVASPSPQTASVPLPTPRTEATEPGWTHRQDSGPTEARMTSPTTETAREASPAPLPTLATPPSKVLAVWDSDLSPDERWRVRTVLYDAGTAVQHDDGSDQVWVYYSQYLVSADRAVTHTLRSLWVPDGFGAGIPHFLAWTGDSSAAYVTLLACPDGCAVNCHSEEVWRVAVSGATESVGSLPGRPVLAVADSCISGARLLPAGQVEVMWRPATGGASRLVQIEVPIASEPVTTEVKPPLWSPDGSVVVVTLTYDACGATAREALIAYRLEDDSRRILRLSAQGYNAFELLGWTESGGLRVRETTLPWGVRQLDPVEYTIDAVAPPQ